MLGSCQVTWANEVGIVFEKFVCIVSEMFVTLSDYISFENMDLEEKTMLGMGGFANGGLWRSNIVVQHFTNPTNRENRGLSTL